MVPKNKIICILVFLLFPFDLFRWQIHGSQYQSGLALYVKYWELSSLVSRYLFLCQVVDRARQHGGLPFHHSHVDNWHIKRWLIGFSCRTQGTSQTNCIIDSCIIKSGNCFKVFIGTQKSTVQYTQSVQYILHQTSNGQQQQHNSPTAMQYRLVFTSEDYVISCILSYSEKSLRDRIQICLLSAKDQKYCSITIDPDLIDADDALYEML